MVPGTNNGQQQPSSNTNNLQYVPLPKATSVAGPVLPSLSQLELTHTGPPPLLSDLPKLVTYKYAANGNDSGMIPPNYPGTGYTRMMTFNPNPNSNPSYPHSHSHPLPGPSVAGVPLQQIHAPSAFHQQHQQQDQKPQLWRMRAWEDQTHKFTPKSQPHLPPPTSTSTTTQILSSSPHGSPILSGSEHPGDNAYMMQTREQPSRRELPSMPEQKPQQVATTTGLSSQRRSSHSSPPGSGSSSPPSSPNSPESLAARGMLAVGVKAEQELYNANLNHHASIGMSTSSSNISETQGLNPSETPSSGSKKRKQLSSRTRHNLAEQKRRQQMRESFERLKTVIPNGQRKISKVALLNETHQYILKLQDSSARMRAENAKLQQDLAKYEKLQQMCNIPAIPTRPTHSSAPPPKKRPRLTIEEQS